MFARITHHHSRIIAASCAASALALGALMPGAWGTAVAQTSGPAAPQEPTVTVINEVVETVSSTETTTLETGADGDTISVSIPAGAMPDGTSVSVGVITNLDELRQQAPPPQGTSLVFPVEINATRPDGSLITDNFAAPVTISIEIEDFGVSGDVVMAFWNGFEWEEVSATVTVDPVSGRATVTATVNHFTVFALFQREPVGANQAVPVPADTGMGAADASANTTAYIALAGVLAAIVVTGAGARYALRHTRE